MSILRNRFIAVATIILACANAAWPADRRWNVASGLWSSPPSWNPGIVPGPPDNAIIDFFNGTPGLARITTSAIGAVSSVTVTNGGTVAISNQGSLLCGGDFVLGRASTHGALNVLTNNPNIAFPGGLTVAANMRLGVLSGIGTATQDAGTVSIGNSLVVGDSRDTSSFFTPAGRYTLTGTGRLRVPFIEVGGRTDSSGTFQLSGFGFVDPNFLQLGLRGTGIVNQSGGTMNVSGQLFMGRDLSPVGVGTYNLSGGVLFSAQTIIVNGARFNYNGGTASLGEVQIFKASIVMSSGGNKTLRADSLTIFTDGVFDLNDNRVEQDLESALFYRQEIARGYNGGAWTGKGITSSAAAAVAASGSPNRTAIGYDTFDAQYTYAGDANLDKTVDIGDFAALAANFNLTGRYWYHGDFNYDGTTDIGDFAQLASNFNQSLPLDLRRHAPVPEPSSLALGSVLLLLSRSRRHSIVLVPVH